MKFWIYLAVMAGVTYLIRMIPLVFMRKKIKNQLIVSFLYYIPYAVLSAMTVPAIFYSVNNKAAALAGFAAAMAAAYFEKSLLVVAAFAAFAVFVCEAIVMFI